MNLTAYLSVDTSNWRSGWEQAENQSDAAFRKITSEMDKTEKAVQRLENSMKTGRERLAERLQQMGASAEQQAQILSRYDYGQKLREQISETKKLAIEEKKRIETLQNLAKTAASIAVGAIAVGGVRGLVDMADKYNEINATIKNATSSTEEMQYFQQVTNDIAQKTYKSYEQVAGQITALIPPIKTLGFSASTIKDFAETLNLGFRANGFKGGDQVVAALSKSFNKGIIDAKAFQQALLAIPDLASEIAKSLGKTEGEVKALGVAGKLTTAEFVKGVQAAKGTYTEQAANVATSVADAFQYLKNATQQFIGESNNASGVTKMLANSIKYVADNIGVVVKALLAFVAIKAAGVFLTMGQAVAATAVSLYKSAAAWAAETAAVMANTRAKTANAIAGVGGGAGKAASGLTAVGSVVGNLAGAGAGLTRAFSGVAQILGKGGILAAVAAVLALTGQWQNTVDSVKYIFNDILNFSKSAFSAISEVIGGAWQGVKEFFGQSDLISGFFADFDNGIFGIFEMTGKLADAVAASIRGVVTVMVNAIAIGVDTMVKGVAKTIQEMLKIVEKQLNTVIKAADWVNRKFGGDGIDFKFDLTPQALDDIANKKINYSLDIKEIFGDSFKEQRQNGLQAYFETMAQEIKAKQALEKQEQAARQAGIDNLNLNADNLNATAASIEKANNNIKNSTKSSGKSETEKYIDILQQIEPEKQKNWGNNAEYYKILMKEMDLTAKIDFSKIDWSAVDKFKLTGEYSQENQGIDANTLAVQENTKALLEGANLKNSAENMGKAQTADGGASFAEKLGEMTLQIVTDTENLRVKIIDNPQSIQRFKEIAKQATQDFIAGAARAT